MTETATATLTKWGNGQGLLIPKRICENLGLGVGDAVRITATEERIMIIPLKERAHRTKIVDLDELFEGYEGGYEPPSDWPSFGNETSWGGPVGKEIW